MKGKRVILKIDKLFKIKNIYHKYFSRFQLSTYTVDTQFLISCVFVFPQTAQISLIELRRNWSLSYSCENCDSAKRGKNIRLFQFRLSEFKVYYISFYFNMRFSWKPSLNQHHNRPKIIWISAWKPSLLWLKRICPSFAYSYQAQKHIRVYRYVVSWQAQFLCKNSD